MANVTACKFTPTMQYGTRTAKQGTLKLVGSPRWHGDIKPENIILVQGQYKLCDPGEALIRRDENKVGPSRAVANGGTRAYGKSGAIVQASGREASLRLTVGCSGPGEISISGPKHERSVQDQDSSDE